eukprot:jgi/Orpsp1_1/1179391/evm.model.c7180000069139.1
MKKLVPFFGTENSARRYSYTDGMVLKNEGRKPQQTQSSGVPTASHIEKLQKKLIQALETNYEVNKKYGNILTNVNTNENSSPKQLPTAAEQKRSAAIHLLRKRTNNIIQTGDNSINSYRKGSIDDSLLTHHNSNSSNNSSNSSNDKSFQRQKALSVLMKRVNNTTTSSNSNSNNNSHVMKNNENVRLSTPNLNLRKYSSDNIKNSVPSININTNFSSSNNNRLDTVHSPNPAYSINSPYYSSFYNYDMISSPVSGMPNVFKTPMESMNTNESPSLTALKNYDMTNDISNTLSPISPSTNFMNARKSINLGSVNSQSKLFENNRLIQNDLNMFDINSCPTSPIGTFSSNGLFFGGNNGRCPSAEELSQKIAENQIMIDYLSKLCIGATDANEKDSSLFVNNLYNNTTNKLPPAPSFMNNEITGFNDYTFQSSIQSPAYTASSSNHSSPSQNYSESNVNTNVNDNNNSPYISRNGSQTLNNTKYSLSESPANSSINMNNLPSPYANNNKIINTSIAVPTSPYLTNSKINISGSVMGNGINGINGMNSSNANGVNSPNFNATPSSSPFNNMGIDKNQGFKRNSYINLMGRGIPSPSPSFSNLSNGNSNNNSNNNSKYIMNNNSNSNSNNNNASPGLYPVMTTMGMNINELSPSTFLNDNISFDLQQQQQQQQHQQQLQLQQQQQIKFNSKSMPSSPNVGYNDPNLFNNTTGNKIIPTTTTTMDQRMFYDNKLNSMLPSMYNNNSSSSSIHISQSMLPAYTSNTNNSTKQNPSPHIGAIGSLRHSSNKLMEKEDSIKMNPLASIASEKRKNSPLINSESLDNDFSQLSLGDHNSNSNLNTNLNSNSNFNFNSTKNSSTLLSGSSPLIGYNLNCYDLSAMEPKPVLSSSLKNSDTTTNQSSSSSSLNNKAVGSNLKNAISKSVNDDSNETTYKLFDNNVYDLTNKPKNQALNNFESSLNATTTIQQGQSLEDSPLINSLEDKNFNSFNSIDIQMKSDVFSNNSNNNNMYSLSMQHPILS